MATDTQERSLKQRRGSRGNSRTKTREWNSQINNKEPGTSSLKYLNGEICSNISSRRFGFGRKNALSTKCWGEICSDKSPKKNCAAEFPRRRPSNPHAHTHTLPVLHTTRHTAHSLTHSLHTISTRHTQTHKIWTRTEQTSTATMKTSERSKLGHALWDSAKF